VSCRRAPASRRRWTWWCGGGIVLLLEATRACTRPADGHLAMVSSSATSSSALHARPDRAQGRLASPRACRTCGCRPKACSASRSASRRASSSSSCCSARCSTGRRRQLLHQVGALAARPHARRSGQGRGGVVGSHRRHLRQLDRQRGDHRHLHHPADEARRLQADTAGAVEVPASVNGQIMPPVMGAAAFLMVEYVGIPYSQVIKHAASCRRSFPTSRSFYIVHLEAVKADIRGIAGAARRRGCAPDQFLMTTVAGCHPRRHRLLRLGWIKGCCRRCFDLSSPRP
jgi:hypothetical protein